MGCFGRWSEEKQVIRFAVCGHFPWASTCMMVDREEVDLVMEDFLRDYWPSFRWEVTSIWTKAGAVHTERREISSRSLILVTTSHSSSLPWLTFRNAVLSLALGPTLILVLLTVCRRLAVGFSKIRATRTFFLPSALSCRLNLGVYEVSTRPNAGLCAGACWGQGMCVIRCRCSQSPEWQSHRGFQLITFSLSSAIFLVSIKLIHSSCRRLLMGISFLSMLSSAHMQDNCTGSIHQQSRAVSTGKSFQYFSLTCQKAAVL